MAWHGMAWHGMARLSKRGRAVLRSIHDVHILYVHDMYLHNWIWTTCYKKIYNVAER